MRYLRNHNTAPYYNMAFDEYTLECLQLDEPLFYLWQNRPAVIVGLNQNVYAEVDIDYLREHDIALVRRVTGGGAVYHDLGNLNYTIVGRSADLNRDYPEYTRYILQALQALGVDAELSGRNDILVAGRKVSGYAKRVYKDRLMVHGTLMYDVDLKRLTAALTPSDEKLSVKGIASVRSRVANLKEYLPGIDNIEEFQMQIERFLSRNYQDSEYTLSEEQLHSISDIALNKFATHEWTYNRSMPKNERMLTHTRRLACGMVEVHLQVESGVITDCRFGGDFIGSLPATQLEHSLMGIRYERDALHRHLMSMNVPLYFDRVETEELLRLLLKE